MLTQGNTKLGPLVWGWSIPAKKACPGASKLCLKICYGMKGFYHMQNVKSHSARNYRISKTKRFTPWMITMLREFCVTTCRIHVVGDFYDLEYIAKWHEIVKRSRQVQFFTYTRSWIVDDMLDPLVALGRESNVQMWFSTDHTMGRPPKRKGIRVGYLMENDDDVPAYKVDLVFRDQRKTVLKKAGRYNSQVCPYDNGVTKTTCTKCGICFGEAQPARSNKGQELYELSS